MKISFLGLRAFVVPFRSLRRRPFVIYLTNHVHIHNTWGRNHSPPPLSSFLHPSGKALCIWRKIRRGFIKVSAEIHLNPPFRPTKLFNFVFLFDSIRFNLGPPGGMRTGAGLKLPPLNWLGAKRYLKETLRERRTQSRISRESAARAVRLSHHFQLLHSSLNRPFPQSRFFPCLCAASRLIVVSPPTYWNCRRMISTIFPQIQKRD